MRCARPTSLSLGPRPSPSSAGRGGTNRARLPFIISEWEAGMMVTMLASIAAISIAGAAGAQTLKVVPHADLRVLDPHLATPLITKMHGAAVYETLLAWDSKLNIRPVAAQ